MTSLEVSYGIPVVNMTMNLITVTRDIFVKEQRKTLYVMKFKKFNR